MLGHNYSLPNLLPGEEDAFNCGQAFQTLISHVQLGEQGHRGQTYPSNAPQQHYPPNAQNATYTGATEVQERFSMPSTQPLSWLTPTSYYNYQQGQYRMLFTQHPDSTEYGQPQSSASPWRVLASYLSPDEVGQARSVRSHSFASNTSSATSVSQSDIPRGASSNSSEMTKWGVSRS